MAQTPMFRVLIGQFKKDDRGNKTNEYKKTKIDGKEVDMKGGVIVDRFEEVLGYNFDNSKYDNNGKRIFEEGVTLDYNWLEKWSGR